MNTISINQIKYDYGKFYVKHKSLGGSSLPPIAVSSLPEPSKNTIGQMYIAPSSTQGEENMYAEYVTVYNEGTDTYTWELLGTSIDMSDYSTTAEMNTAIATALSGYATKSEVDNKFLAEGINNNGHTYVDLGLPSGTLWATMNVGANSETDYGNYYKYGKGANQYNSSDSAYVGTEDPLDLSVDTARQVWGGSWHMPTKTQMQELKANTTYRWVTNYKGSGINGGTFTATNGAVLFIPAAGNWFNGGLYNVGDYGDCWGSSPNGSSIAYFLNFGDGYEVVGNNGRNSGYSVRPVIEPTQTEKYATKTELATKQDVIDSSHKLSADLVDDTNTANKFTNATEKQTWNGKQDALTFNTAPSSSNKVATMADVPTLPENVSYFSNEGGEGIIPMDGIRGEEVNTSAEININPDVVTFITGGVGSNTNIILTVPDNALWHVWDVFFTVAADGGATIVVPTGATLHVPSDYSIVSGKTYEIRVIGKGLNYYLAYGEFA